tara:strand:- start:10224 stop:10343 length:120 start_codon:yes stop_codon:yes gene_type:complete
VDISQHYRLIFDNGLAVIAALSVSATLLTLLIARRGAHP